MLKRYSSINDHLSKIPCLLELLLSPVEDNEVKELSKTMVSLKSVMLVFQRDDMDMAPVRHLFDELLRAIPKLDAKLRYLKPNSQIIKCPEFEQGIVKISNGKEAAMSVNEQLACRNRHRMFWNVSLVQPGYVYHEPSKSSTSNEASAATVHEVQQETLGFVHCY